MSDELWLWLMSQGWRMEAYRPDRREYLDIPASFVTRLTDADPDQRNRLLNESTLSAQPRAALVRGQS